MRGIENIRSILKNKLQYVIDNFDTFINKENPSFDQNVTDGIYNKLLDYKYQINNIMSYDDFPIEERMRYETLLNEYNRVINNLAQYVSFHGGGKISNNDRSYFKKMAISTAKKSHYNKLKVGCVLVKNNRIVCASYNDFLPNSPNVSVIRDNHEQYTIHAEQNAIAYCAKKGINCSSSQAYITHFPCINCFKILCASGINKIYYMNDYKNDNLVYKLSDITNVPIIKM